jgi:O-acetyl-ADP-ribose deacetylase (regulator of RNase III)
MGHATATQIIERKVGNTTVALEQGDLTALEVDAFVFYAKNNLELGSGYGTAIQTRGGDSIKKELQQIGSIGAGETAVTGAGRLKARYIIHACGPKFQEPQTERLLRDCTLAALRAAHGKGVRTLALPPLGAGFYGIPLPLCSAVMLDALREFLRQPTSLERVVICVVDRREYLAFKEQMEKL